MTIEQRFELSKNRLMCEIRISLATGKQVLCLKVGLYLRLEEQQRDAYGYKAVVGVECMRNETSVVVKRQVIEGIARCNDFGFDLVRWEAFWREVM